MTWPKKYGGHERSALERYVVLEEMLAAGAPVGAHWVADRQSGPLLLRFGTEEQRQRFLPRHRARRARLRHRHERAGLGLGSGLASARAPSAWTAATRSTAPRCGRATPTCSEYMIALFRTKVVPDKKHEGLSQFLVDLKTPGITHPAHHRPLGRAPLQRGGLPGRLRARGHAGRRRGRRLEAGHHRAGLRAQRPGALPVVAPRSSSRLIREVGAEPDARAAVSRSAGSSRISPRCARCRCPSRACCRPGRTRTSRRRS